MPKPGPAVVSPITHTRRTVLEWLSGGVTLSLLPPALGVACTNDKNRSYDCCPSKQTSETGGTDSGGGGGTDSQAPAEACEGGIEFQPGNDGGEVYEDWPVRTVDHQDPNAILKDWKLTVDGMVDNPASYSFEELLALARHDQTSDFHCVEGWSVYDVPWNGLHISELLERAGLQKGVTHITFHTVDGIYNESLPLDVALEPETMLAYGVCDATLPLDHGFPLRLVVPRLLAYKNPKYVQRIEFTDHAVEGYWVQRGYSYEGEVPEDRLRD